MRPIVIDTSINKPNHIGSNPKATAIGINIGTAIIIIEICSIIVPIIIKRTNMIAHVNMGDKGKSVAIPTIPRLIPVKAKSWLKATDPATIIKIMVEMAIHLLADIMMTSLDKRLYPAAIKKLASAPNPEASVGVATPEKILPRTARMIIDKGSRYLMKSMKRFEEDVFKASPLGAMEGLIRHNTMI